jgi:hypothetical protein
MNYSKCLYFTLSLAASAFIGQSSIACEAFKACGDIRYCAYENLTPANRWQASLATALQNDDLNGIVANTNACQSAVGSADWSKHSAQCDLIDIGHKARTAQCAQYLSPAPPPGPPPQYCYTQGKYYEIGHLGPPGQGVCRITGGGGCACGDSPGQLK